ncbi:hypothetical protein FisN_27Lu051 [Fistulifera solaris]|uniref:Uncharacterized protein n=1 Tax=Fistulifera solaris TaxID=1519565 RepID=A0A1Z5JIF5_FISSO|nr:hypothetical protein FisN_27Lu051 [Fistulifera solaris]|eukprot:GAX13551.1 hypothetical protein FisN_27Lu051 [Fistulifera solaris]
MRDERPKSGSTAFIASDCCNKAFGRLGILFSFSKQQAVMRGDSNIGSTSNQPATLALEAALLRWDQPSSERKRRQSGSSIAFGKQDESNVQDTIDFPSIEWSFSSDDSVTSGAPCIDLKTALFQSQQQMQNKRRLVRCRSIFKDLSDTHRSLPSASLTLERSFMQSGHFYQSDPAFRRKIDELKVSNRSLDEILSNICIDSV